MVVCVIGLGSMGKRRIRLLKEYNNIEIVGIDSNEGRCKEASDQYGISSFNSLEDALSLGNLTAAFVCTSPLSHASIITECLENNLHVFTEINLVQDGYEDNMKLAKERGLVLFLSSTFLYRKEPQYIINRVKDNTSNLNYIYHVGQYLPDWHPWENYNDFFVSNPRTNGCREIFAIELPWIISCFGNITDVTVLKGKISNLNVNYNDNYLVQIQHQNGNKGIFAVDIVSRKAVRKFEVYGENIYLTWGGTPDTLIDYDVSEKTDKVIDVVNAAEHTDGYASFITENPYRDEIASFMGLIDNPTTYSKWDFQRDIAILEWIDKIEE